MTDALRTARALGRSVLYEGYLLYPYAATSLKNRERVSLGELVPGGRIRAELPIVIECETIDVEIAFLQPVNRIVHDDAGRPVDQVDVGDRRLVSFAEGREIRETFSVAVRAIDAGAALSVPAGAIAEDATVTDGDAKARISRRASAMECAVRLGWKAGEPTRDRFRVLTVEIENRSVEGHPPPIIHAAHVLLSSAAAPFVSIIDPPIEARDMADRCESDGLWPVLAGPPGDRSVVLLAPLILYDHPALAPESPGDLFDATENDELLTLSILALTDDERRTMAATDPRAAEILARVDRLGSRLESLHGAARSPSAGGGFGSALAARVGDRVVLRPLGRDALDPWLAGRSARIVDTVTEVTGREHFVIVVDDDPGRDLGEAGIGVGHRFFVSPDEVEILSCEEGR